MSNDSPAAILFDELGNPVGVVFDGYVYRLQTESKSYPTSTATRTMVDAVNKDTILLVENPFRLNAVIYNCSSSPLYIGLGTTPVTSADFTYELSSQSSLELPQNYIGEVHGYWASITPDGWATMTELTP